MSEIAKLLAAMKDVLTISDRDHVAWVRAKEAIAAIEAAPHLCGLPEMGTYAGQVVLVAPDWLAEKWPTGIGVDVCLAREIQGLWATGIRTTGHCCGHGKVDGFISVEASYIGQMFALSYVEQTHPDGRNDHFWPKTKLYSYPGERAAQIASMHAHHALWQGLLAYGWGEDTGKFGVGLANRIAQAIREDASRAALLTALQDQRHEQ